MFFKRNIPAVIWALIIFILCSMPSTAIPTFHWLDLLSFDKFVHASIFFVLQILLMRGLSLQTSFAKIQSNYKMVSLFSSIMYGGMMELMQYYLLSSRSGDVLDFIANAFGCLIGLLIFKKIKNKILFLDRWFYTDDIR